MVDTFIFSKNQNIMSKITLFYQLMGDRSKPPTNFIVTKQMS